MELTFIIKFFHKGTFNLPGTYYALIDNNFVKSLAYGEPLYGLKKPIWYFTLSKYFTKFSNTIKFTLYMINLVILFIHFSNR